jgi:hypothetical protein
VSGYITPVLVEGLDKVLLIRLYPEAAGITDAGTKAMAQGHETGQLGQDWESSQHEPVLGTEAVAPAPPAGPPGNVDVPYVSQAADLLNCTMGNWTGEPTSYAYVWKMNGAAVGSNAATYTITTGDVGKTATCVVTATNAAGSTQAPPSNGVVVAAAARSGPGPHREA